MNIHTLESKILEEVDDVRATRVSKENHNLQITVDLENEWWTAVAQKPEGAVAQPSNGVIDNGREEDGTYRVVVYDGTGEPAWDNKHTPEDTFLTEDPKSPQEVLSMLKQIAKEEPRTSANNLDL